MRSSLRLLPFALLLLALPAAAQNATPAGEWAGEIAVPGSPLGIKVTLTEADGAWGGTISIPAQNLADFALAGVEVAGDSVRFRMDGVPGTPTFAGTLQEDASVIAGDFMQGGSTLTFRLQRADAAQEQSLGEARDALDGFGAFVEEAMADWDVPGAAVAVVKGGEVVFLEGFGMRDVEDERPVTPQTLFPIGSATKAFTATVLATLEDEGRLEWEEPVIDYLPGFRLDDPFATAEMTAVDLLTHRSGLPRHDLLWYATPFSREELFGRLRHLEPTEPFRTEFQYQNLMYMAAGILGGELAGSSWEDAVRERIFAPLGMERATLSIPEMQRDPNHAKGYGGGHEAVEPQDPFAKTAVGPAGTVNASAEEMARWALLQLSEGEVDGRAVVSAENLDFLHAPQIVVSGDRGLTEAPYLMYALGWFVEPYRGRRMLHHGGNIDGFSALVGFMPGEEVGILVLTNKDATPLPRLVMLTAFDRLLGEGGKDWRAEALAQAVSAAEAGEEAEQEDAGRVEGTTPSHPLGDYAGTYRHPAYGDLVVSASGDALRADYYEIGGALAHYHYDTFVLPLEDLDQEIKLTFAADASGGMAQVAIPLEPTLDAVVFERLPDAALSDPDYLARFTGDYLLGGVQRITVALHGDHLTVSIPGQPTYTLEPEAEDVFALAEAAGFRIRFEEEAGEVVRLLSVQPNGTFAAERLEAP